MKAHSLKVLLLLWVLLLTACGTPPPNTQPSVASVVPQIPPMSRGSVAVHLRAFAPQIKVGQWLALTYRSSAAGYANLYAINSSGKTMQLLFNRPVVANQWQDFPEQGAAFGLKAMPPVGEEHYILLVTEKPFVLPSGSQQAGIPMELGLPQAVLRQQLMGVTHVLRQNTWGQAEIRLKLIN